MVGCVAVGEVSGVGRLEKQYFIIDSEAGIILHGFRAPNADEARIFARKWQNKHDSRGQNWLVLGMIRISPKTVLRTIE
jgi:hypothetical protein